ncbi:MAG: GtrA family protein [Bdellovibrionota bacterium]
MGALAALVNFGTRILLNKYFGFSVSVVIAYIFGMVTAFGLMKMFVFTTGKLKILKSAYYFVVINLIAVFQTWAMSMLMAYIVLPRLGAHAYVLEIAHAVGVMVPVFTSYLGHKYITFQ